MKRKILVLEPDDKLITFYSKILHKDSLDVIPVKSFPEGLSIMKSNLPIDAVILNYSFISKIATEVFHNIRSSKPHLVMILTGSVPAEKLTEYTKYGINDYIDDPYAKVELLQKSLRKIFDKKASDPAEHIQIDMNHIFCDANRLVGQSDSILSLKKQIHKVAPLDSTVLVCGETGTGKEVIARMIHSMSPQRHNNFIAVHCGGIPDTLLESTLFGHEKGAFTGAYRTHRGYFEIANNGTIFLDEIGDTTPSFQVKLLRVLQDKQFRHVGGTEILVSTARVIAATNRNLKQMVAENKFREDLFYRLNVITLTVPPLRERPEDLPLLIRHFMQIFTRKHNLLGRYLKPETMEILKNQRWAGNVRELENVIERLVVLSDSDWIGPSELPDDYLDSSQIEVEDGSPILTYAEAKNLFECEYIAKLIKRAYGNISRAAKMAEMPRQNLHLKIRKHNLKAKIEVAPAPQYKRVHVVTEY